MGTLPQDLPSSREPSELAETADQLEVTADHVALEAVILHVAGAADHDTRQQLEAGLAKAVAHAPAMLIVDLTALTFCDSSALNTLLHAHEAADAAGTWMVVVGAGPQFQHLMALTGTDQVFTVRRHMRAVRTESPPWPAS